MENGWYDKTFFLPGSLAAKNPSTCVEIAHLLIENGLNVNSAEGGLTLLYRAVASNNRSGIELAKFLLENGADPTIGTPGKSGYRLPGQLPAISRFPKVLGVTWEELVASTWGSRHQQPTEE